MKLTLHYLMCTAELNRNIIKANNLNVQNSSPLKQHSDFYKYYTSVHDHENVDPQDKNIFCSIPSISS